MEMTVLYFTGDGMYFQGPRSLVSDPKEARRFVVSRESDNQVDAMLEKVRDAIYLNIHGINQVRLIGQDYNETGT